MADKALPVCFPHTSSLSLYERASLVRNVIAHRQNFHPSTGIRPLDWSMNRNHLLALTAWASLQEDSPAEVRLWNTLALQNSLPAEDEEDEDSEGAASETGPSESGSSSRNGRFAPSDLSWDTGSSSTNTTTNWTNISINGEATDSEEEADDNRSDSSSNDDHSSDDDEEIVRPYAFMYRSGSVRPTTVMTSVSMSRSSSGSTDATVTPETYAATMQAGPPSEITVTRETPTFTLDPLPPRMQPFNRASLRKSKFATLSVQELQAKRAEKNEYVSMYGKWLADCELEEKRVFENEEGLCYDQVHSAGRILYQNTIIARKKYECHLSDLREVESLLPEPEYTKPSEDEEEAARRARRRRGGDESHRFRFTVGSWDGPMQVAGR